MANGGANGGASLGVNAFDDFRTLLTGVAEPVVFDVGADVGQSAHGFRAYLPDCVLHSFEPGPRTFRELEANTQGLGGVQLVNAGVGSKPGRLLLVENDHSDMSSFLRPARDAWGAIIAETPVEVITLDGYCAANQIDRIDLLKIDTQGYELEVLKGATRLLAEGRVELVYLEVNFAELYAGQPPLDVLYRFLVDRSFRLVWFYNLVLREPDQAVGWCDALFRRR